MYLLYLELLVQLNKQSRIKVEEYILLLEICKVNKTKTKQKEREKLYKLRQ